MSTLNIKLPDGSIRTAALSATPLDIAGQIGKRLREAAIAARIDGKLVDVYTPFANDSTLAIVTRDSAEGREVLRHSTAHLLAHAIKELYPTAQITIGPVIADGFYYDIDCPVQLTPEDLPVIEAKMQEIAKRNLDVRRQEVLKQEAIALFRSQGEYYKAEIIEGIDDDKVSLYRQGDFVDLCRGPHVPNTSNLVAFKLLSIAGAYWRGDEKNKMLQRIYGTAFATQKELDTHLFQLEEARRRDHRKLGPEMGLFTFLPIAPAMPFYLPKGTAIFNALVGFMRKEVLAAGYQEVICPQVLNSELWKTSGHWNHYRENMFCIAEANGEEPDMALKPMNCPGHASLFGSSLRSYRELPLRFAEFTRLHRNERAGVTHGLFRTRAFSQDDAHIFCTDEQIQAETVACIDHTLRLYKLFGFQDVKIRLATRPKESLGTDELWEKAISTLAKSLEATGSKFDYAHGEGAFYGPKIEFHVGDSLGRFWQCGTVQLDYSMPEQFKLAFTDRDNTPKRPVMIHRAIFGSVERFMGILLEHVGGHLPPWLAPVQARVLNVTDESAVFGKELIDLMNSWGIRCEADFRTEKLGYKIREAQLQRIPFILVIGNKEAANRTVSMRRADTNSVKDGIGLEELRRELENANTPGGTNH